MRDALFGRDRELELIREFLDRATAHGDALVLLGDPGVGKTALLKAAETMATAAGGRVLTAAGVESEADVTFSGLHEALLPMYDEISELTDPYREALTVALGFGDGAPPDRLRVANATLALLSRAASSAPLLLTIDDLPWLDTPSAVVLSMVARRLRGSRVAMLGASRTGEESFFERAGLRTVALGPLDNEAAEDLMSAHFPTLAPAVRARLLARRREIRWRCWSFRRRSAIASALRWAHCRPCCRCPGAFKGCSDRASPRFLTALGGCCYWLRLTGPVIFACSRRTGVPARSSTTWQRRRKPGWRSSIRPRAG
jgi:AAA ATPase domain